MRHIRNGIEYNGSLAEFISSTPEHELKFYDLVEHLTNQLYNAMERQGLNKADIASKLKQSRAAVTQTLSGETNFTLMTLAKYLTALDADLSFKVVPKSERVMWSCHTWPAGATRRNEEAMDVFTRSGGTPLPRPGSVAESFCTHDKKRFVYANAS